MKYASRMSCFFRHRWVFVEFGEGGYTDQVYKCAKCGATKRGWHSSPTTINRP